MEMTIERAFQQGVAAHKDNNLQEAERFYRAVLQAQPAHPDANHNLGIIAVSVNKAGAALPLFKTALEANPKIEQFWLSYIDALIREKQFENAKEVLEQGNKQGVAGEKFEILKARLQQMALSKLSEKEKSLTFKEKRKNFSKSKQQKKKGKSKKPLSPSSSQSQLNNLIELFKNGRYEDAEKLAISMTQEFPENQFAWDVLGAVFGQTGRKSEAINAHQRAVQLAPQHAGFHYNLGKTLQKVGRLEEAESSYKKAISVKPDFYEACYNLGVTLQELGRSKDAEASYRKAIALKPDYAKAHNNLGNTLQGQYRLDEAEASLRKAIAVLPDYAEARSNLGNALKELGRFEEAEVSYRKAIALQPDFAKAHSNLGVTLQELGRLEEAELSYRKAIALQPDFAKAHSNLGVTLQELGRLEEAEASHKQAIQLKPDFAEAWNNIYVLLRINKSCKTSEKKYLALIANDVAFQRDPIALSVLKYRLSTGGPYAKGLFHEALDIISSDANLIIKNPGKANSMLAATHVLPEKIFALLHFGRSGTSLLHGLVDNHPEISTLPSIYFSEYFDRSTWDKITAGGWNEMADRFISMYPVLFDARAPNSVRTLSGKYIAKLGLKMGMANVGENRDEFICIDKNHFREELISLIAYYEHLDALIFFKLVHLAYERALSNSKKKATIFYHIHNPDAYAKLNFINSAPAAGWLMMVREPLQSCESWVRENFIENNYDDIVARIITMLFSVDDIVSQNKNSVGVRLEDLKNNPKETISALCDWMGIREEKSLYQATAQGKRWWSDLYQPNSNENGVTPFGKSSIQRKLGSVFTEKDQFILRTFFYPFSVAFGYADENLEQFKDDLQKIRPMIDEVLGFEEKIITEKELDPEQFMMSSSYLFLRSNMIERWSVLNEFHTYPNMLKPLKVEKFLGPNHDL
jgi:tetratricopeptide (TPR) repeat protein